MKSISVTFDTNAANLIADPAQYSNLDEPPGTAGRLRTAIAEGQIIGFVSEASVFIECLSLPDKLTYLTVALTPKVRPSPDLRRIAIYAELTRLGVRLLHAPLLGAEIFIDMPWATDDRVPQEDRVARFQSFIKPYRRHHALVAAGEKRLRIKPLAQRMAGMPSGKILKGFNDWALVLKRDWDDGDTAQQKILRKEVEPLIAEWCDTLIVGSHYSYGIQFLCTMDVGKQSGSTSLFHNSNRANLEAQGIKVASPAQLVAMIS